MSHRRHSARRRGTLTLSSSSAIVEAVDDFLDTAMNTLGLGLVFSAASLSELAKLSL